MTYIYGIVSVLLNHKGEERQSAARMEDFFFLEFGVYFFFIYRCISIFVAVNGFYPVLMSLKSNK